MKILPPTTQPPREPFTRRHRPRPAERWQLYRACLRWDFGFTCALCLLHESDLAGGVPTESLGVTSIEHRIPRSTDVTKAGDYDNCLYVCRWCNRARGAEPVKDESGVRLLDPTVDAWADHFEASGDRLEPREGDASAARTHAIYEIDDPRKVARRQARRELIEDRFALRDAILPEIGELLDAAESALETDRQTFLELIAAIQEVRRLARRIFRDLDKLAACPVDAPEACRCGDRENHSLPPGIEEGLIDWFESELAREREP